MNAIALVDCNNFFVSCERLFRPDLARKPVVVLSSNDGCVISRSGEAKGQGITMGEPYFKIRDVCKKKGIAVFSSNFDLYRDVSHRVMATVRRFSDEVEVYSVDEAFFSVPYGVARDETTLSAMGGELRATVAREVGVPVSIGFAPTKTLAKVATHFAKPARGGDGVLVLMSENDRLRALAGLPVGEVWGVGFRLEPKLKAADVRTAADLVRKDDRWVRSRMSIRGLRTVEELRGIPRFAVGDDAELRKSLMHSQSFGAKVSDLPTLEATVAYHARKIAETLRVEKAVARQLFVAIRTSRHVSVGRYVAWDGDILPLHSQSTTEIASAALGILKRLYRPGYLYAKAGVMACDIVAEDAVPARTLFSAPGTNDTALVQTLDTIKEKYGNDVIRLGVEGVRRPWRARHSYVSPRYTTQWHAIPSVHVDTPRRTSRKYGGARPSGIQ